MDILQDNNTIYRESILDLHRHPLNKKVLADFDVEHKEYNPACGDDISVQIKFDDQGKVKEVGHQGQGCAISQAAVSLVTEEIKGKSSREILNFKERDVYNLLGFEVIYTRRQCALLGLRALQRMICHWN